MGRSVLAILAGYLIFAVSAALLFALPGRDPLVRPALSFMLWSTVYGCCFAALGGYVAAWLAPKNPRIHSVAVASFIAAIAIVSLSLQVRKGSVWSQTAAVIFMTPAAWSGGRLRARGSI